MLALDIVCLEDDVRDAERARIELLESVELRDWRVVSGRDAFSRALAERTPDLILADYALPDFAGRDALAMAQRLCPRVPFIFLSGSHGEELAIETLKLGATDYVLKGADSRLARAVGRAIAEAESIRSRTAAQAALAAQGALLKRIVDAIPELIFAINGEGRITAANQALLCALDRSSEAVLGCRPSDFAELLGAESDVAEDQRLMQTRRAVTEREVQWHDRRKEHHWQLYSKLPLIDPTTNAVTGLLIVSRDITESRMLEREVLEITEREQRRVGSDLHDGLGQELTGLSLMIKALEADMRRDASPYLPQIRRIGDVLHDAFASAHSLAKALAPTNLDRGGVAIAIDQLAHHCTDLFGVRCEARGAPKIAATLCDSAASHVYRIAQEATVNAAKHAHASRVVISLMRIGADLDLTVIDDGIGFDAQQQPSSVSMGLKTMAYRARILGGSLIASRNPTGGTRVECRFPIRQNQRAA